MVVTMPYQPITPFLHTPEMHNPAFEPLPLAQPLSVPLQSIQSVQATLQDQYSPQAVSQPAPVQVKTQASASWVPIQDPTWQPGYMEIRNDRRHKYGARHYFPVRMDGKPALLTVTKDAIVINPNGYKHINAPWLPLEGLRRATGAALTLGGFIWNPFKDVITHEKFELQSLYLPIAGLLLSFQMIDVGLDWMLGKKGRPLLDNLPDTLKDKAYVLPLDSIRRLEPLHYGTVMLDVADGQHVPLKMNIRDIEEMAGAMRMYRNDKPWSWPVDKSRLQGLKFRLTGTPKSIIPGEPAPIPYSQPA